MPDVGEAQYSFRKLKKYRSARNSCHKEAIIKIWRDPNDQNLLSEVKP